jgi:hypothetical protein
MVFDQSLVGSVVIDAEIDREDHRSIPATVIEGGWNHLMLEPTYESDSTDGEYKNKKK